MFCSHQLRSRTAAHLRFAATTIAGALAGAMVLLMAGGAARAAAPDGAGLFLRAAPDGAFAPAPDLATEVRIDIGGIIARVQVRQRFHNPFDEWQEGVYVFPLPDGAAVDGVRLRVGGRIIVGEICERLAAARIYRRARAAGRRATMVEQERPNVFTVSLANIGPGETVAVEIGYQQTVRFDAGAFRLRFPLVVAPRYVNGPPTAAGAAFGPPTGDAGRLTPDAGHVTPPLRAAAQGRANPVRMSIRLDPGFTVEDVAGTYHGMRVSRSPDGVYDMVLDGDAVPAERDFELAWRPRRGHAPEAALFAETRAEGTYVLLMVMPPSADEAPAPPQAGRQIVFVMDTSGSMHGPSLDQAKVAVAMALARLRPADRFNVVRFSDRAEALFAAVQAADEAAVRLAMGYVAGLAAEGGTEMVPALALALDGRRQAGRVRQVVFLTDGAVGDEAGAFRLIAQRLGDARLFTVGIGAAPNGYFMRRAAALGRGSFTYIGAVDLVGARMKALFAKLERPALTHIGLDLPDEAEVFPGRPPDLYHGQPLVLTARLAGAGGAIGIAGKISGRDWRARFDPSRARPAAGVARLWARRKLQDLADGVHTGADPARVRRAATRVALAHGLISPYTSLVAVDATPARPAATPLVRRAVPLELPRGWDRGKPGGAASAPARMRSGLQPAVFILPQTATWARLEFLLGGLALFLAALAAWRARRPA